jgi:uncharacterized protein (TIGR02246 family)
MDLDDVAAWLDAYIRAWESNDPDAIGELFTEDAVYFPPPGNTWTSPHEDVLRGREAIVAAWLEDPDPPGSWVADYRPEAIASDLAIATGTSTYFQEGGETVRAEYSNVFLLRFDADMRCREYREWYMRRPAE